MTSVQFDPNSTTHPKVRSNKVRLLPDPEVRPRVLPKLVSVDDHVVEPPDLFGNRLPEALAADAPRVVEQDDGSQLWAFDGQLLPNIGLSAVVGRPPEDYDTEPTRFDEMRRGCFDPAERVRDMDINGVAASLNFPSMLPGFSGLRFARAKNRALGAACVRAWNDWMFEEWVEPHPDRFIACGITYLSDVDEAVAEVHRNAARGFRAVSFCELPELAGLPSLHTGYWDPFVQACVETDTVICLHVGSSATTHTSSSDAPVESISVLFPVNSEISLADWLFSKIPIRFPEVKIAMSEGGIGWVPMMMDRADRNFHHLPYLKSWSKRSATDNALLPSEVMRRNFWFCAIDEPYGLGMCDILGAENVLLETDYPHADSSWPNSQAVLADQLSAMKPDEVELLTWKNATSLFRLAG